jgi:hypothetical protein
MPAEAPPHPDRDEPEPEKRRLERLIPELVKRFVGSGNDLRLPKEVMAALGTHVDEVKSEVYKVVVREVREFLQQANFANEVARVLTGLTLEVKTQVRFVPNDAGSADLHSAPDIGTKVSGAEVDFGLDLDKPHASGSNEEKDR